MIVFLTALDLEGEAVRAHLAGLQTHHHPAGTVFEVGHLAGWPDCAVALAVIGMGTVNAAAITERAITEFRPTAVVFVGIAGGLREWIALGDVVVATRVYAYHGGRVDQDAFLARPRAWDTSHRLVQLAKYVNRTRAWPGAAKSGAAVHFEPVAAGEIVLNSPAGPEHDRLHAHYNDAVAIEMESAGVALAGQLYDSTPTIAVRGISDHADGAKNDSDRAGWQPVAARNAASFAVGLAATIRQTQEEAMTTGPTPHQRPHPQARANGFTHTGGVSAGRDMRLDRGSKAVGGDDNSNNSRRGYRGYSLGGIRLNRSGLAAAAAGILIIGGGGIAAVSALGSSSDPEPPGNAALADFCLMYNQGYDMNNSDPAQMRTLAAEMARVGTPPGMPADVRAGFEVVLANYRNGIIPDKFPAEDIPESNRYWKFSNSTCRF
ncbi:5'-methylthioadenosine/S-adenosylhomocysteine nucleosidase [Nocardia asteroides]|uniref:5'-methylthioadenosine/S-adenosylhomocysteine nucleosidase family protein n=1 Tax=Nocardia asteroides TaxID=1824 RepID=UPI003420924F